MLDNEISGRLATTFECFFKHSIKHFIEEPLEYEDKIQCIFSLQEALELLLKFYIVTKMGYRSIIEDCQAEKTENELPVNIEDLMIIMIDIIINIIMMKDR